VIVDMLETPHARKTIGGEEQVMVFLAWGDDLFRPLSAGEMISLQKGWGDRTH